MAYLLGEEEGCGYRYHGVSMKATSVQKVPSTKSMIFFMYVAITFLGRHVPNCAQEDIVRGT